MKCSNHQEQASFVLKYLPSRKFQIRSYLHKIALRGSLKEKAFLSTKCSRASGENNKSAGHIAKDSVQMLTENIF